MQSLQAACPGAGNDRALTKEQVFCMTYPRHSTKPLLPG
jgi:hypothetical protein